MQKKTHTGLHISGTDVQLSQAVSHLEITPPTEGNPACQVCGEAITEGQSVTLYLSRAAGHSRYTIGQCRCSEHNDDLTGLFTLGVRELVIDGRVGQYHPHDTQQNCPILLNPAVRLISSPDTKSGRVVGDHTETNLDISGQCRASNYKSNTPDAEDGLQSVLSFSDRDGTVDTTGPQSIGGSADG